MKRWWFSTRLALHRIQRRVRPTVPARIIFILGTGRSGTHFLAGCLISHSEIVDFAGGKENSVVARLVAGAAVDPRREVPTLARLETAYSMYAHAAAPRWFLDQSHPNIWFAEYWAQRFPSAFFIGIERNPYSVVASMMKHAAVRRRVETWTDYPIPNRFLGITEANAAAYAEMSTLERCALRWCAHHRRLADLRTILGASLFFVPYEQLCGDPSGTLSSIADILGIDRAFSPPLVDQAAASRFDDVSKGDRDAIDRIVAMFG